MVELYPCPAEDCDVDPAPLESIAGHYAGKRNEAHSGGWEKGKLLAEQQGPVDSSGETSSADSSSSITFPDSSESTSGCPDCGHPDWHDADELLDEFDDEWDDDARELLEEHDRVCADCGEVYDG